MFVQSTKYLRTATWWAFTSLIVLTTLHNRSEYNNLVYLMYSHIIEEQWRQKMHYAVTWTKSLCASLRDKNTYSFYGVSLLFPLTLRSFSDLIRVKEPIKSMFKVDVLVNRVQTWVWLLISGYLRTRWLVWEQSTELKIIVGNLKNL